MNVIVYMYIFKIFKDCFRLIAIFVYSSLLKTPWLHIVFEAGDFESDSNNRPSSGRMEFH